MPVQGGTIPLFGGHEFSIESYEQNRIVCHLAGYDYRLAGFCLNNRYFVEKYSQRTSAKTR